MAEILHARVQHTWLIIHEKVYPYDLKLSHHTSVTNIRTTTMPLSRPWLAKNPTNPTIFFKFDLTCTRYKNITVK